MNAVPPQAIERIEVLRDGAAAQYGSDAISGVINIVLKSGVDSGRLATHFSQTEEGDGRAVAGTLSEGIAIGDSGGFLNGTVQVSDRGSTDRSGTYNNTVYLPLLSDSRYFGPLTADERARQLQDDALVAERGFDRNAMVVGNASSRDYRAFFNSAVPISGSLQMYGFGGYNRRYGRAAGFYRYPNAVLTRNLTLYPDGYLPFIETDIDDATLAIGARRTPDHGWNVDLSNKHGFNSIQFEVDNSLNPSLGAQSPRHFHNGTLSFAQNTTNLDFSRRLDKLGRLRSFNMAFGAEYRVARHPTIAGPGDGRAGIQRLQAG
jgi:iron complex outermembrane receptor protein